MFGKENEVWIFYSSFTEPQTDFCFIMVFVLALRCFKHYEIDIPHVECNIISQEYKISILIFQEIYYILLYI